jgi:5-methylcytosine-specific restriction endonuclease McrA
MIKQCKICNKEFESNKKNKKYCSLKCKKTYKKLYMHTYFKKYKKTKKYIKFENSKSRKEYLKNWHNSPKRKQYIRDYQQKKEFKLGRLKYRKTKKYTISQKRYHKSIKGILNDRIAVQRRITKLNSLIHSFNKNDWLNKLNKTKGICPMCKKFRGKMNLTIDHTYPISLAHKDFIQTGIKRIYTINDINPLCLKCNSKKGNKLLT